MKRDLNIIAVVGMLNNDTFSIKDVLAFMGLAREDQDESNRIIRAERRKRRKKTMSYSLSCQTCGKNCKVYEEVEIARGEWEMWCYCADCDLETFHPNIEQTGENNA